MRLPFVFRRVATPLAVRDATPITTGTAYLRSNDAPDYRALNAFVEPRFTTSACSIPPSSRP